MKATVSSNQKYLIDTQKLKRKEHKQTNKENHETIREETKRPFNILPTKLNSRLKTHKDWK